MIGGKRAPTSASTVTGKGLRRALIGGRPVRPPLFAIVSGYHVRANWPGCRRKAFKRVSVDAGAGRLAKPKRAVAHHDRQRLRTWRDAVLELGYFSFRGDATDLAHFGFGEPDVSVGTEHHGVRTGVGRRQREFRDFALHRDAADLAGRFFREPQIALGTDNDPDWCGVRRRQVELLERVSLGIESADFRSAALAEPQAAIAAFDRDVGFAAGGWDPMLANGWRSHGTRTERHGNLC